MSDPKNLRERADSVLELHEAGESDTALAAAQALAFDAAAAADTTDPVVRETLFTSRFITALVLTDMGELARAADAYAEAAETPADLDDPDQRHEIAMALLNRGICLSMSGSFSAAIEAYEQLIAMFREIGR